MYFEMPMWACPSCNKEQQYDEYYDLKIGSSMMCQYCEAEFEVEDIECAMHVQLATMKGR